MRRRILLSAAALFSALLSIVACTDRRQPPTAPEIAVRLRAATAPGTCTTLTDLTNLVNQVFGAGSPNANSALGKLSNLDKQLQKGDLVATQDQARNLIAFILNKADQLVGQQYVNALIASIQCYAGLTEASKLIFPSDQPQVLLTSNGEGGIKLEANPVSEPTLMTVKMLPSSGPAPLITKLDQYPGYLDVTQQSGVTNSLTKPVTVAVCPSTAIPDSIRSRLRLGHQASAGFEITPPADASFLNCAMVTQVASRATRAPAWVRQLASLVAPRLAWARQYEMAASGVGGSATEYSPFAPVDPELSLASGVGGSATEYQRAPETTGKTEGTTRVRKPKASTESETPVNAKRVKSETATTITDCSAVTVGTAVPMECRPQVTVRTVKGTIFQNVPVQFAVTVGGGMTAVDDTSSRACGPFGTSVSTRTNVNGKAGACWTVGDTAGTNTLVATPSVGGDAPVGVTFSPATVTFTVTATKITPLVTATGGTFTFDALPHAGSGTCSNDLTPVVTYSGDGVPVAAGSYTVTVTCGTGSNVYNEVSATATLSISPVVPTVAVTCPANVVYNGAAQQACTAVATGPGLTDGATTITYENNVNVGTATATASFAAAGNYAAATGTGTFSITPAQTTTTVSCTTGSIYTGVALTPCVPTTTGPGGLDVQTAAMSYADNVNVGTATATATYAAGGNYLGSTGSATFAIAAAGTTVAITCPASVTYSGSPLTPCSATVSGPQLAASVPVSYSNNTSAGTATVTASYAGGANWEPSTSSASFTITKLGATATSGSATINFGAAVPTIPCAVSGLLAGDAGSVTCVSSVPPVTVAGPYAVTPVWSPANPLNYAMSGVNGLLTVVGYTQVNCFSSPIYWPSMPDTKSAQRKGSNVPVKCGLTNAQGQAVMNATGNLTVEDHGTDPVAAQGPAPVGGWPLAFSGTNVFKVSSGGNYAYGLDTSPAGFIVGHYYYVRARWNDGSISQGWFLLK